MQKCTHQAADSTGWVCGDLLLLDPLMMLLRSESKATVSEMGSFSLNKAEVTTSLVRFFTFFGSAILIPPVDNGGRRKMLGFRGRKQ